MTRSRPTSCATPPAPTGVDRSPTRPTARSSRSPARSQAVTLRPKVTVPALVADVFDGSGTVQLVWLGRRSIGGINPGVYVKATGLVCRPKGTPVMYNPAYEILPGHGG